MRRHPKPISLRLLAGSGDRAEMMRAAIMAAADFAETIKWTNLLFSTQGPCIVIRAEEQPVILALFRGKRLAHLDPRIKPSGKYELGNLILDEPSPIDHVTIERIAAEAARLNAVQGDPTARL